MMPGSPDEPDTNEPIPLPEDGTGLASGHAAPADEANGEPADDEPDRVNLSTPDAAAYWARHFQVTVEQMHAAVEAAGNDPRRVAAHLGKPWPYTESGIV